MNQIDAGLDVSPIDVGINVRVTLISGKVVFLVDIIFKIGVESLGLEHPSSMFIPETQVEFCVGSRLEIGITEKIGVALNISFSRCR